jgi:hypothetical protein
MKVHILRSNNNKDENNYQSSVGLAVKAPLYPRKDENTSSISGKRIYWEGQSRTPNETSLTL